MATTDDVRSRFPGLSDGWVRFDGPAGTLPVDTCVDAIADYLRSPAPANLGGLFDASIESVAVVDRARAATAELIGVEADEVVAVLAKDRGGLVSGHEARVPHQDDSRFLRRPRQNAP